MGITFPGSYCNDERFIPHYWIESDKIEGGILFKCAKCPAYVWLSNSVKDSERMKVLIAKHGYDNGYCKFLDIERNRPVKIALAKIVRMKQLKEQIADPMELAKEVNKILFMKDFDRKEV